jgi:hypothetical protein
VAPDTEHELLLRLQRAILDDLRRAVRLWELRDTEDPDRVREKALQKSLQDA